MTETEVVALMESSPRPMRIRVRKVMMMEASTDIPVTPTSKPCITCGEPVKGCVHDQPLCIDCILKLMYQW